MAKIERKCMNCLESYPLPNDGTCVGDYAGGSVNYYCKLRRCQVYGGSEMCPEGYTKDDVF